MFGQSRGVLVAGIVGLLISLLQLRTGGVAPLPLSVSRVAVFASRGVRQRVFLMLGS